jgi:hypothetical protein
MLILPLLATPNQNFTTQVGGQVCKINLYTGTDGLLYFDLFVANAPRVQYVICQNRNLLVDKPCLGFAGDFMFNDTQGSSDPDYSGLGARFELLYLTVAEAAAVDIS